MENLQYAQIEDFVGLVNQSFIRKYQLKYDTLHIQ